MSDAAAQVPMPLPSRSGAAMADVMPVMPIRPKAKRWSIKTKFRLASLALALAPLILFVAITRTVMLDLREDVEAALIQHAHKDIALLDRDQALIASAMLEKVEAETQMAAFYAEALLRDPDAFGQGRSNSANEMAENFATASKYVLAPGVSLASAQSDLDLTSKLQGLFDLIAKDDPNLAEVFIGTQSGVFRVHPWKDTGLYVPKLDFTVDSALALPLDEGGKIPAPLWQAFEQNGLALSPHMMMKTIDPDNQWAVSDDENGKVISLQREKNGLAVYSAYDPRIRPWYRSAVGRDGVAWTIYRDFGGGKYLFSLPKELKSQIGDQVSPGLAQEFARRKISLVEDGKISMRDGDKWTFQDRDGNNYEIRAVDGELNVYDLDLLTCSRAVLDSQGRVAGVVGLDVNMESIRSTIIHTPNEIEGYAFLLNDKGELIDQERPDMFIPAAGGAIRSKMTAGKVGDDYDASIATNVFYAPIRSIHSPDGKSFWSLGISMPEAEITRMADPIRNKMVLILEMIVSIGAVIVILVIGAARRMANGITKPIEGLRAGVMRIGSGDLDYRLDVSTNDEIEDLANAFNKMVCDLQAYVRDLKTTTAEKERFASELQVAHDIQMSFLKKIFPAFPHRSDFSLYATIKTAREVGGDLYDFSLLDDDRLVFYIGDVSDKGVPASLIMAITMTLMKRASAQPGMTPARILKQVNVTLAEDNANSMFVTLFIGILNVKTGELTFSNAGHNPPLILGTDGDCRFLTLPDGVVLGVMPEAEYRDDTVQLQSGATIVTYTDGVTEAMNPQRELYSEGRLQETLTRLADRAVEGTVDAIISSVKAHAAGAPQSDDIAVLALRRN
jgi:serine phosphatase RsbU (regulator of sigma subunit)/HAMP domain-containing protein